MDEDDYESDDDGDVFAFVPPDLGPAPELQHNPLDPSIDNQNRSQHPDYTQQHQQHSEAGAAPATADQNETYYFDEATGAVYDSQGRLVDVSAQNLAAAAEADAPLHAQVRELQYDAADDRASPASEITMNDIKVHVRDCQESPRSRLSQEDPPTTVRTTQPALLPATQPVSPQPCPFLRCIPLHGCPSEVDSLPASRSGNSDMRAALPHGTRDIGTTASGAISLDQPIPAQGKRQSAQIDAYSSSIPELRRSPESSDDIKYPLDTGDYTYEDAYKDEFPHGRYGSRPWSGPPGARKRRGRFKRRSYGRT